MKGVFVLDFSQYAGVALIPLVIGISEIFKRIGMNEKFIPLLNLLLGLVGGIAVLSPDDLKAGIIQGLFIGLSASGLYSGVRNTQEGIRNMRSRKK